MYGILYAAQTVPRTPMPCKKAPETKTYLVWNPPWRITQTYSKNTSVNRFAAYTGSAGGLGAALYAFLCARLVSGASFLAEHLRLSEHIGRADLVITGEGKLDSQTLHGKVVHTVVSLAEKQGRPVIVLAGTVALTGSMKKALPNAACFSIVPGPMTLAEALKATRANLERTAEQLARYCTCKPHTTGTTPPVRQSHTKPEKKPTMQIPQTKHLHTDTHLRRKANLRPTKTQRS